MLVIINDSLLILLSVFFIIRGVWMIKESGLLKNKWVRILAASIDTLLLGSAIVQAINISQYPFIDNWLTAKVLALVAYIALGMIAFTYGQNKEIRITAWLGALLCFAYIASVALTRNPMVVF